MNKKKIVYLDQNFISDIAKTKQNPNVNQRFGRIFNLLHKGFIDEKLIVPKSMIHKKETALATQYKKIIREHQGFMGQISMEDFTHIFSYQAYRAAEKFLGIRPKPVGWREAFKENPDKKTEQYGVIVDSGLWEDGSYKEEKKRIADLLNNAKNISNTENRTYKDQKNRELEAQRKLFLQMRSYTVEQLFRKNYGRLVDFTNSKEFINIPYIDITIILWPSLFIHHKNRTIKESDYADIETIATYLPYVDIYATDKFMAEQIKQRKLDSKYITKVFSSNSNGLVAFEQYLKRSIPKKNPVNWPQISIFVLSDKKLKEKSWEFFRGLGNQCHGDERGRGWVEVYAFDDGNMPRYYDHRINNYWPFYGLQDVTVVKIDKAKKIDELCKSNCRTTHYLLLDSYLELPDNFVANLLKRLIDGKTKILNYQINHRS